MEELERVLFPFSALVTYTPLRSEVDAGALFDIKGRVAYAIAPRASLEPSEEALAAMKACGSLPTAVLMPGRRFDVLGTRHGQGGGWYDRFLARVPETWLRIGFCHEDRFSLVPLARNAWDQPMDYVCVFGKSGSATLYETRARQVL